MDVMRRNRRGGIIGLFRMRDNGALCKKEDSQRGLLPKGKEDVARMVDFLSCKSIRFD